VDPGIDHAADGKDDIPRTGLVEGVLERSRTGGRGGGDDDDPSTPPARGFGPESLGTGKGGSLGPGDRWKKTREDEQYLEEEALR
jgi:hypothetical protein